MEHATLKKRPPPEMHERNDEASATPPCERPSPPRSIAAETHGRDKKKSVSETYSKSDREAASTLQKLFAPSPAPQEERPTVRRPLIPIQCSRNPSPRTRLSTLFPPPARMEHVRHPSVSPTKHAASKLPIRIECGTSPCRKLLEQMAVQELPATTPSSVRQSAIPRLMPQRSVECQTSTSSSSSSDVELIKLKENEYESSKSRSDARRGSEKTPPTSARRPLIPSPQSSTSSLRILERHRSTSTSDGGSSDPELIELAQSENRTSKSRSRVHRDSDNKSSSPSSARQSAILRPSQLDAPSSQFVERHHSASYSGSSDPELIALAKSKKKISRSRSARRSAIPRPSAERTCHETTSSSGLSDAERMKFKERSGSEKTRPSSVGRPAAPRSQSSLSSRLVGRHKSTSYNASGSSDSELGKLDENENKFTKNRRPDVYCGVGKTLMRRNLKKLVKPHPNRCYGYRTKIVYIWVPTAIRPRRRSNSSSGYEEV